MADFKNCDPCSLDRQNSTAISFCVVCVEYLCETCNRDHQRNKMTRAHKILTNGDLPKDPTIFHKMKELLSCTRHSHEKISFRCLDHNELICITCCAVNHRKCEHVEELMKCPVNSELLPKLDGIDETVKSVKNQKTAILEQLRLERENVEKERVEFIKSLTEQIEKLDKDSEAQSQKLVMPYLLELVNDISRCQDLEFKANFIKELLEVTKKYGEGAELAVISRLVEKNIDELDRASQDQKSSTDHKFTIKFKKNSVLKDVAQIGEFTLEKIPKHTYSLNTSSDELMVNESMHATGVSASSIMKYSKPAVQYDIGEPMEWRIQKVSQHCIRSSGDKETCCVNGLLLLPSGYLLVAERRNRKIKVFMGNLSFAYELSLENEPVDICQVETMQTPYEHVACVEDSTKRVKVFSLEKHSMTKYKECYTKLQCLSIAMFRGSEILILSSDKPLSYTGERERLQIDIRDMHDGHIRQTFDVKHLFDQSFDTKSLRIHYTSREAIIVSERQRIHCLNQEDKELKEIWFYKGQSHGKNNLEVVSDIDSDEDGNVYICGKVSENIHQVSADSYKNNRIIIFQIKDPSAIYVDSKTARIIMGRENTDNIHVFYMRN